MALIVASGTTLVGGLMTKLPHDLVGILTAVLVVVVMAVAAALFLNNPDPSRFSGTACVVGGVLLSIVSIYCLGGFRSVSALPGPEIVTANVRNAVNDVVPIAPRRTAADFWAGRFEGANPNGRALADALAAAVPARLAAHDISGRAERVDFRATVMGESWNPATRQYSGRVAIIMRRRSDARDCRLELGSPRPMTLDATTNLFAEQISDKALSLILEGEPQC